MSTVSPREVPLGGLRAMTVRRTLPNRERTTIGAWCFIDHYGPNRISAMAPSGSRPHGTTGGSASYVQNLLASEGMVTDRTADYTAAKMAFAVAQDEKEDAHSDAPRDGMFVAPHPHTGLQTVTWLFSGEVEHRDSVGSVQHITPGSVNLMTAGSGIQHAEVSAPHDGWLHGVQLWVVLPDAHRNDEPFFEHFIAPHASIDGATVTVFVGTLGETSAPTTTFSDLLGAELNIPANATIRLPYRGDFEYGVLVDQGRVTVNGETVEPHHLSYVEPGSGELVIEAQEEARILLLGGVPFDESIVMWWNFIARSHEEIVEMREAWQNEVIYGQSEHGRFGHLTFAGTSIPAPEMPRVRLKPRGPAGTHAD